MRTANRIFIALALTAGGATALSGQAYPGTGMQRPGAGDAAKISSGNRENNAEYNRLIGAGDDKPAKKDERRASHAAVPAAAADIKAGAPLRDIKGAPIGTVATVDADGVVVDTGQTKIKVPVAAFGKDDQGILLGITAAKFNELVAKAKTN